MSTTALTAPAPVDVRAVHSRPGLGRLVAVELRKAVDTRGGLGLLAGIVLLTIAVVIARCVTGAAGDHDLAAVLDQAIMPAGVLLPVAGVLLVTTEWSQRTGLITFALVPDRLRVVVAKTLAAQVLAIAALTATFVTVAIGVAASGGAFTDAAALMGQTVVYLTAGMLTAVAFGLLLRTTAPALVALLALPSAWMAILTLAPGVAPWLDTGRSFAVMHREVMDPTQWAQAGTAMVLWAVVPLVAGLWRTARQDPFA